VSNDDAIAKLERAVEQLRIAIEEHRRTYSTVSDKPQYREPTMADVGQMVEVQDSDSLGWAEVELLAVLPHDVSAWRFLVRLGRDNYQSWQYARIKVEVAQ
jgi:hypothetical protein